MDLDKLKTFIAVTELGSFTSAAGMVNLTQSAVSQQLKELENELDVILFDRSSRPVTLTREGVELLPVAKQMLQYWQNFKEDHEKNHLEGKLTIGYISSIMTSALAHALQSLRDKHPGLAIKLVNTGGVTRHLAEMVAANKLNASFGAGRPTKMPRGLIWRPYSTERYFVISKQKGSALTDGELLSRGPYLRFVPYLLFETTIDKSIKQRGIKVDPIMELDSYDSILLMVNHNIGVGIVPESYLISKDLSAISCIPFGVPPLTREMGIMIRHDSPDKRLVNLLHMAMQHFSNRLSL